MPLGNCPSCEPSYAGEMAITRANPTDVDEVRAFLAGVDLTVAGIESPSVTLWIDRDENGRIVGSTGYELSAGGDHALIRSVAVVATERASGAGTRLASFAITHAQRAGATRAWLFSRRSGPFWRKLGFEHVDRRELAAALSDAHQVRLFTDSGQLEREQAWSMRLEAGKTLGVR